MAEIESLNMLPNVAAGDLNDKAVAHTIFFCQRMTTYLEWLIFGSNLKHLSLIKFCTSVSTSKVSLKSIFSFGIPHIIPVGANKEVSNITARRIIAGVANLLIFWNWSISKNPYKSVHSENYIFKTSDAVTLGAALTIPFPTRRGFGSNYFRAIFFNRFKQFVFLKRLSNKLVSAIYDLCFIGAKHRPILAGY